MVRDEVMDRKGGGKYWRRHIYVQQAPVQLRARATRDHVWPNSRSLETQLEAANALFPHLEVIGDFHSHPYQSARTLRRWKGWEPSEGDDAFNREWVETMREYRHNPHVAFIIAIGKQKRSSASKKKAPTKNVKFLMIGNNLIGVSVYRILPDATYEARGVELRIPDLPEVS